MFGFGFWEVLLILGLVILIFGAKKIPDLARGLGAGIRNFKGEMKRGEEDDDAPRLEDGNDRP